MALLDNKRQDGIGDRINLARSGSFPKVTTRLVVSYFNWYGLHSRLKTTAAQRAGLTQQPWTWHDLVTYPTIL
jgi:hypothetical protein